MRETRVTEVKRHIDGRVERFDCALVLQRPHLVVARYDLSRGRRVSGVRVPAGGRTFGVFWRRRPYVLYRFEAPDGRLLAHRFDVVEKVRIGDTEVSYVDLLLDVWIPANAAPVVEDEDDVAVATKSGALSREQRRHIAKTKERLLRVWPRIVREAEALIRVR
jgi:predicted RNA-binding protein associated with RNAse of E/G family